MDRPRTPPAESPDAAPQAFFAAASRGTEEVLAEELRELRVPLVEATRGGVRFGTTLEDAYRVCLWSRVASRVLNPIASFTAGDPQGLYEGVYALEWADCLSAKQTLAVDVTGGPSPIGSPRFIALKTKDAIVDRIRDRTGARPDIDTEAPDVGVSVHVSDTLVTVSLDLGGRGLHRRGIGRRFAEAPLKENRAAAILRMAGWPSRYGEKVLLDPFCGSGTILLEAAWMALDVAPGLLRPRGGTGWRGHDRALWDRLVAEARDRRDAARELPLCITGSDQSDEAVRCARANIGRAGLSGRVHVDRCELRHLSPPGPHGLVVTNPPYGVRLGDVGELGPLYELMGDVLKRRFAGWTAWVLVGSPALAKCIGLRPASRRIIYNGPIECRLLEIPIAGAPSPGSAGPAWRAPREESQGFARKLRANLDERTAWARREHITCYRLYDSDVPEFNLAVDWYDGAVRVEEYAAPRRIPTEIARHRLRDAVRVVSEVLGIGPDDITLRVRRRRSAGEQHGPRGDLRQFREVREGALRFLVNLTDYLDTGLFLDDRLLRRWLLERAWGSDVLNLFAYTCTASVAAAVGGARSTTSVELSATYLAWGRRNFALNGVGGPMHRLIRADVLQWLKRQGRGQRFDVIFLAPPTHSRSKGMRGEFDVQRDCGDLLRACARCLSPGGCILFTTNLRSFVLPRDDLDDLCAVEVTGEMTPPDFRNRPRIRAWLISVRGQPCRFVSATDGRGLEVAVRGAHGRALSRAARSASSAR